LILTARSGCRRHWVSFLIPDPPTSRSQFPQLQRHNQVTDVSQLFGKLLVTHVFGLTSVTELVLGLRPPELWEFRYFVCYLGDRLNTVLQGVDHELQSHCIPRRFYRHLWVDPPSAIGAGHHSSRVE
jgi:hypothetical protein